jgi:hypothetical protein
MGKSEWECAQLSALVSAAPRGDSGPIGALGRGMRPTPKFLAHVMREMLCLSAHVASYT